MVERGDVMDEGAAIPAVTVAGPDGPIALADLTGRAVIYFQNESR